MISFQPVQPQRYQGVIQVADPRGLDFDEAAQQRHLVELNLPPAEPPRLPALVEREQIN